MPEPVGILHRILAPSFVDGPGSRMAVFLQGCEFRCPTCHNPETQGRCLNCGLCVPACPHQALRLVAPGVQHLPEACQNCGACELACPHFGTPRTFPLTPQELLAKALPWVPFLDGLTFTGGECTGQPEFLVAAARLLHQRTPWTVLVDTHGDMPPATLGQLAEVTDGFLFDLKALEPAMFLALTGREPSRMLANLETAARLDKLREVRILVVPGHTDRLEVFEAMVAHVAALGGSAILRLQPFRRHGVRGAGRDWPEPSLARLQVLRERAEAELGKERVICPALAQPTGVPPSVQG